MNATEILIILSSVCFLLFTVRNLKINLCLREYIFSRISMFPCQRVIYKNRPQSYAVGMAIINFFKYFNTFFEMTLLIICQKIWSSPWTNKAHVSLRTSVSSFISSSTVSNACSKFKQTVHTRVQARRYIVNNSMFIL